MAGERAAVDTTRLFDDLAPLIAQGQLVRITVAGHSMSPFLAGGRDEVVLSALGGHALRPLDVLLYRRADGRYVMHRLVKRRGDELYMMGDAESKREGPLRFDQICAVATAFVRKGRTIETDNWRWRFLSRLWLWLRPVRRLLLRLNWRIGKVRSGNRRGKDHE